MNDLQKQIDAKALCEAAWSPYIVGGQWRGSDNLGMRAWCCHHEDRYERLSESPQARIDYIFDYKPEEERIARFDNFRPMLSEAAFKVAEQKLREASRERNRAWDAINLRLEGARWSQKDHDEYNAIDKKYLDARDVFNAEVARLHRLDVPHHTWNGSDIFGGV